MNLTDLTSMFKARTGRLDLTDAEILVYLNSAVRVLDKLEDSGKRSFRIFIPAAANTYIYALPPNFRDAFNATLHTLNGSCPLSWCPAANLMAIHRNDPNIIADNYENTFAIITSGLISDLPLADIPVFGDVVGLQAQPTDRNLYILIHPKTVSASTLEIECSAYTSPLSESNTANYWSNTNPELIIQACFYLLTKDLVNIDESTKILNDLKASVRPIVYDYYEQEHINTMEG